MDGFVAEGFLTGVVGPSRHLGRPGTRCRRGLDRARCPRGAWAAYRQMARRCQNRPGTGPCETGRRNGIGPPESPALEGDPTDIRQCLDAGAVGTARSQHQDDGQIDPPAQEPHRARCRAFAAIGAAQAQARAAVRKCRRRASTRFARIVCAMKRLTTMATAILPNGLRQVFVDPAQQAKERWRL